MEGGTIITNPDEHTTDAKSDLPKLLLSVEEACEVLNLGRTAVFEEIRTGRLRSVKRGRTRLIPRKCVYEYIDRLLDETDSERAA